MTTALIPAPFAPLAIGSVYSGILGLDRAVVTATGGRVVWHVEPAAFPRAVIRKYAPSAPLYETDDVVPEDAEAVDILIGGPPCQPTSLAGKRKGTDDERWRWPWFLQLVRRFRPRLVFVENPASLLTLSGGRAFGGILAELAALGLHAEWCCVRASDAGAPHRRERLFLMAYADGDVVWAQPKRIGKCGDEALSRDDGGEKPMAYVRPGCEWQRQCRVRADQRQGESAIAGDDVDGCCGARDLGDADVTRREGPWASAHEGRTGSGDGRCAVGDACGAGRQRIDSRCESAGGAGTLPASGWAEAGVQTQSGLGGDVDGLSGGLDAHRWPAPPGPQHDWEPPRAIQVPKGGGRHSPVAEAIRHRRPRLKALGNAVVAQQALLAWRILEARIWP